MLVYLYFYSHEPDLGLPEMMTFNDQEHGWRVMTRLIHRIPHSQKLMNHISTVNDEKILIGNVYEEDQLRKMGIRDPKILEQYKKSQTKKGRRASIFYPQIKQKCEFSYTYLYYTTTFLTSISAQVKKKRYAALDNTSQEWKLRNLSPRVRIDTIRKKAIVNESTSKSKPKGNIETFLKRNYGPVLSAKYETNFNGAQYKSQLDGFQFLSGTSNQKRPQSELKTSKPNRSAATEVSKMAVSRLSDLQMSECGILPEKIMKQIVK